MDITTCAEVFLRQLLQQKPQPLKSIPKKTPGLYWLWDHERKPRYHGMASDLFDRVFYKHVSGSPDRSHMFSRHYSHLPVKERHDFVRTNCGVTYVPFPELSLGRVEGGVDFLKALEREILSMAPEAAIRWNGAIPSEKLVPSGSR